MSHYHIGVDYGRVITAVINARCAGPYVDAFHTNSEIDFVHQGLVFTCRVSAFTIGSYGYKFTLRPVGAGRPLKPVGRLMSTVHVDGLPLMRRAIADAMRDLDREVLRVSSGADLTGFSPTHVITDDPQKETKVKKLKKFYIGKPDVIEGRDTLQWAKDSLPEVIEQATARARETGQPQYIVKVIKVVSVKETPVVVKDIK